MRDYLRKLMRLKPYSDFVIERLTARHDFCIDLAASQEHAARILDVGCASGWFEYLAPKHLRSSVCGVEVSEAMLEQAKRNAPEAEFVAGSVFALPFADGTFDGAVMFEVIEHVPKQREVEALREVRRVMKIGSWLLLSTPYAHPLSELADPAWIFGHRHYSRRRIELLLHSAGFLPINSSVRGGLWDCGGTIALYIFKWLLNAEPPFKDVVDRHRRMEFHSNHAGIGNIFVQAVAS